MTNEKKAREISLKYVETSPMDSCNFSKYGAEEDASYDSAIEMADWKDEQFAAEKQELIDNACEWLIRDVNLYVILYGHRACVEKSSLIKNFRKAMEETK